MGCFRTCADTKALRMVVETTMYTNSQVGTACDEISRNSDVRGLEVVEFSGKHYKRAIEFGGWCVAFLNHGEKFAAPTYIERHDKTDEVFALIAGEATLLIGEKRQRVKMERGKLYNVRKGTWHQIQTTPGTSCLVVENAETPSATLKAAVE